MNFKPFPALRNRQVVHGLNLVIKEGLTSEGMTTLTGGTFLIAMALLLGASNFQIGLIAALPTMTNAFQIITIWLLQRYNNRKVITVISNGLARLPLLLIGLLPLIFSKESSVATILFILSFHYFFGSMAGAGWNAWMKDLVPDKKLGSYFSKRTRATQTLNVCLSLALALVLDFIKTNHPGFELTTYAIMFVAGSLLGLTGTWLLSRTPEPQAYLPKENIFHLLKKPFADTNFRRFLFFQSSWTFALNIAMPFLTVYMLQNLNFKLSTVIIIGIASQLAGIFALKMWGRSADNFSNKTIIRLSAPLYIACILLWPVANMYSNPLIKIMIAMLINITAGFSIAGVNLGINNIAIKLAEKKMAVVYLSAKSMVMAVTGAVSPILGGLMVDFFSKKHFAFQINFKGFLGFHQIKFFELQGLGYLFIIGGILAIATLQVLKLVRETGEISKKEARQLLHINLKKNFFEKLQPLYAKPWVMLHQSRPVRKHRKIMPQMKHPRLWNITKAPARELN